MDPRTLHRGQQSNPSLSKVKSNLLRKEISDNDPKQRIREDYLLDDKPSCGTRLSAKIPF